MLLIACTLEKFLKESSAIKKVSDVTLLNPECQIPKSPRANSKYKSWDTANSYNLPRIENPYNFKNNKFKHSTRKWKSWSKY